MPDIDIELTGAPAVNITARPAPVNLTASTPSVDLTIGTPAVSLDVNAVVGGGGGVADTAWTEVDLTSSWIDVLLSLFGYPTYDWDFGPTGFCTMRWTRIGRTIRGNIWGKMDGSGAGHSVGIPGLTPDQLPTPAYLLPAGSAVTTNFGYIAAPETSSGAGDGHIVTIGPLFTDFGDGAMTMTYVHFNPVGTDGGLGNLFMVDGGAALGLTTTPDLSTRTFTFQSSFEYEAATAA
jgi:hypothetical protein